MLNSKQLEQVNTPTAQTLAGQLRWWQRPGLWTLPVYVGLTLLLTWPLALHWTSGTVRGTPDHYLNLWSLWWVRSELIEQQQNPYYTELLFYPYRSGANAVALYYHPLLLAVSVPGSLLSYAFGFIATFNTLVLLAFALSGWTAYFLGQYFLENTGAAFVVGVAYTFSTYHFHNLSQGQLSVIWWVWIPLYVLFLHRSLSLAPPGPLLWWRRWRDPLLAALWLGLATLTDWYSVLYLLLYTAGLALYRLAGYWKQSYFTLVRLAVIGLAWALPTAPLLLATLRAGRDGSVQLVEGAEVELLQAATLPALFDPNRGGGQWPAYFLGFVALGLAALGLWWGWRKGAIGWAFTAGICTLMSLGPYWRLELGENAARQAVQNGFMLPYWLLSQLPLVNIGRSPIRFNMLGRLGLAMLAGWAVLALLGWAAKRRPLDQRRLGWLVPALVTSLFLLEVQTLPLPIETLPQPAFFQQVAAEPGNFALLELPITNHYTEDNRRMFFQTQHHRSIAGGYISRKTIDYFRQNGSLFGVHFDLKPSTENGLLAQQSPRDLLAVHNFRYVINYKDEYPADDPDGFGRNEEFLKKLLGPAAQVYEDKWLSAWRVGDLLDLPAVLTDTPGFYVPERRPDGQVFRWATDRASLTWRVPPATTRPLELSFVAWSFEPENKLEISLDGRPITTLQLYGGAQTFTLPPLNLPPGQPNRLTFRTLNPARSPQQLNPASPDQRPLAFALAEVKLSTAP